MPTLRQHYAMHPVRTRELTLRGLGVHEWCGRVTRPRGIDCHLLIYFYTAVRNHDGARGRDFPPGTLILWEPDTPHDFGVARGRFDHSWLLASGRLLTREIARQRIPCNRPLQVPVAPLFERALLDIHREVSTQVPASAPYVTNLLHNFLIDLGRQLRAPGGVQAVPEEYLQARAYLESHLAEPITLSQLAAQVYRSVPRFASRFKALFGVPPIDYLIRLRLERAMVLLRDRNWTIKQIAREVGYDELPYFSRLFRRHFGVAPREARRRLWKT
jgi:AraC-like DNA-binding protein